MERQVVQWVDGPEKAGGDGTGSDDRGMKLAGDATIVERGTPQLNVQELGQERQLKLHKHETQEAFSEHEEETQGALLELEEETQEALSEHEQEQQHEEGEAKPASGSANLEGPALPALRKLTTNGNIPPILSSCTRSRRPHTGVEGETSHFFLPAIEAEEENGAEDALACDDGGQMAMQATLDIPQPRNRRQAMESPEWDEWRKAEGTEMLGMVENCVYKQVARPKDKLVVGTNYTLTVRGYQSMKRRTPQTAADIIKLRPSSLIMWPTCASERQLVARGGDIAGTMSSSRWSLS